LPHVRYQLDRVIAEIDRCRTSEDPRVAWVRSAGALTALVSALQELATNAHVVEVTLQHDTH
jgi:hypothetical protein